MKQIIQSALLMCLLISCKGLFQYSPNEVRLEEAEKNLNRKNIEKLLAQPVRSSIKFAVIGDSQRSYEELEDFVNHINQQADISFVVLNGDITDFGMNREYKWINRSLSKLRMPCIAVIGNHDMLSNGSLVYQEMFGAENFSFTYANTKFIFFNSCSRETGFDGTLPNLSWLQTEIESKGEHNNAVLFSHVPPFDKDFDSSLQRPYASLLSSQGVRLSVHGHQHKYSLSEPYNDGVQYLVASTVNKRSYAVVNMINGTYEMEQVCF